MAAHPRLPTTTHLVGHLMREVESALRDVAEPAAVVANSIPDLAGRAAGPSVASEAPLGAPPAGATANRGSGRRGRGSQEDSHAAKIRRVLAWLDIPDTDPVAAAWFDLSGRENPNALHKRAHRDNLNPPRPVDAGFAQWWDRLLDVLDTVLARLEDRYGDVFARIDVLVAEGATSAAGKIGVQVPTTLVTQEYLMARLGQLGPEAAADWLAPLRDAAFFRSAPGPVPAPDGSGVSLPFWPQAEYLAFVAPLRPVEVREVIAAVETENANVRGQLLRAALRLPPGEAALLAPIARGWASTFGRGHGEVELARFVAHVLSDPAVGAPAADLLFEIAGVLLGREDDPSAESAVVPWRRRGRDVAGTFAVLVPALLAYDARRTLIQLAEALDRSIAVTDDESRARAARLFRPAFDDANAIAPEGGGPPEDALPELASAERDAPPDEPPPASGEARPTAAERTAARPSPRPEARMSGGPPSEFRVHLLSFTLPSLVTAAGVDVHRHRAHDMWELLAVGLRDAALGAVAASACTLAEALDAVLTASVGPPPRAAGRVALAVLARVPDADPGLVAAWLLDPAVCDDYSLRSEYDALLAAGYRVLAPEERVRLAERLAAEPLPAWYGAVEPEVEAAVVANRRRDRLAPLRGQLPEHLESFLDGLIAAHGDAERSDQDHGTIATWSGPRTPIAAETLAAMSPEELVGYLREWTPEDPTGDGLAADLSAARRAPTYDGLARTLERVVASAPDRYADIARALAGTRPAYVRAALQGFRSALGDGRTFPWMGPLALAAAAAELGERGDEHRGHETDEEWRATRQAVASLLEAGLGEAVGTPCAVPAAARADVWVVLERLAEDADPAPGGEHDGIMATSVRASAIEAVVAFALWAGEATAGLGADGRGGEAPADASARDTPASAGRTSDASRLLGFAAVPEASRVLAAHARWEHDPSLGVRAAFGRRLGQLAAFDPAWTAAHLPALLPAGPDRAAARGALTATYLALTRATPAALPVLDPLYRHVIETAGADHEVVAGLDPGTQGGIAERAAEQLGEHLADLYWSGVTPFEVSDGLLAAFFRSAGPDAREHLLSTLGRWLYNAQEHGAPVPDDVRDRLVRLWEWRVRANEPGEATPAETTAGGRAMHRELAAFGWWFGSVRLDVEWRLRNLERALRQVGSVEPDYLTAETLVACAAAFPAAAVACLAQLDLEARGTLLSYTWREAAVDICRAALASGDAEAVESAHAIIGRWAARGHTQLLALRATPSAEPSAEPHVEPAAEPPHAAEA
jgi:hypothetical protein